LVDAVNHWASGGSLSNPFYQFTAKSKDLFEATPEEEAELLKAIQEARDIYSDHYTNVKGWRKDIAAAKKSPADTIPFSDLWDAQAPLFIDSLIAKIRPEMMNRPDKLDLLNGFVARILTPCFDRLVIH